MIKWIKNTKGAVTNKTSGYKGIVRNKQGKYEASLCLSNRDKKGNRRQHRFVIGSYVEEKDAVKARVDYILDIF
ncbi:hypothetical protein Harreka1_35 [Olleya phage Harreka_1]|uniref:AP2/ERF domain-containing protein n=1 Tax=Olleya phage Harreka_1 TaxID=2745673 RepID=A0A8E4ZCI0_9CAUD|nr:hypothetical protein M1M26_gp35 [Olleya phage Harreka_1]QQV90442.1 hypothetical protein Harreka1_35 [Olleya phage Harreka_1]